MSMIDGMISGLDTSGVINELLAAQRAPAQRLAARQQAIRAEATTFAGIRALVDQVKTAAQALDGELDWRAVKATSSDEAVATVVARSTATETSLSFTVDRLAQAHQLVSGVSAAADIEWADGDIVLEIGGEQHTITVTPNPSSGVRDLDSVVAAINGAGLDVRATKVNVGDGEHRLQLASVSTGAASEFTWVRGVADQHVQRSRVGHRRHRQENDERHADNQRRARPRCLREQGRSARERGERRAEGGPRRHAVRPRDQDGLGAHRRPDRAPVGERA